MTTKRRDVNLSGKSSGTSGETARLERVARGHKADAKGLRFEQTVTAFYFKKGWKIQPRYIFKGLEIDLFGKIEDSLEGASYLLVECKDKDRVTSADVMRFIRKVDVFYKALPEDFLSGGPSVTAVLAHTGVVNEDSKAVCKGHEPRIAFKKF